jgi:predicted dehydrogenase
MTTTLNFGFIGAGQISTWSAQCVNKHPRATVLAAHDLNPVRLAELCESSEIPRAYKTAEELLADPEIDAVYIAVPNKFHAPLSIQALKAGKHVILDKPFALSLAEAETVAAVARSVGKVFTLGMNQRFTKDAQKIKTLVATDQLGEVYHAKAYWLRREGIPRLGTWFGNKELAGAGCLYDIGVHMLDLCLHLLENFDPVSVSGTTYTRFGNRGRGEGSWGKSDRTDIVFDVDDFATAFIRMRNGTTVSLDAAWACHTEFGDRHGVTLFGSEGGACTHPARLFKRNPAKEEYEVIEDVDTEIPYPHLDRFHNFINHLLTDEPLCVTIEQALAVQRILDAIAESSRTGREVVFA